MTIHECAKVKDILRYCTFNTTVVFDIDNTLLRPTREEDVGSDQWFRKILQRAFEIFPQRLVAIRQATILSQNVQKLIKLKPVEPETPQIIKVLQDLKLNSLVITARGDDIADLTIQQLRNAGINFSQNTDEEAVEFMLQGKKIIFKNNILFCDGVNKGLCLVELLKLKKNITSNVVMLDDNEDNLKNVGEVLDNLNFAFTGLRYSHLDERVEQFDLKRANAKLSSYSLFFSKSVANIVKEFDLEGYRDLSGSASMPELRKSTVIKYTH